MASPATKTYVLLNGRTHTGIVDGEFVEKTGDGTAKQTFDLTDEQFASFKDKFVGPLGSDEASLQLPDGMTVEIAAALTAGAGTSAETESAADVSKDAAADTSKTAPAAATADTSKTAAK